MKKMFTSDYGKESLNGRLILIGLFLTILSSHVYSQTCTISGSGTINWTSATCIETGSAPVSGDKIVVPNGVTLNIPNSASNPIHTGNLLIESGGTFTNNKANAVWNGDVNVASGGTFSLEAKLDLGSSSGCGYDLTIFGTMTLNGSGGSDLLSICGVKIAQSGGSCTTCTPDNGQCSTPSGTPYCEPSGGFVGPTGYSQTGYTPSLPVKISYFKANSSESSVTLEWATYSEENFSKFEIERSTDGVQYEVIGSINGVGEDFNNAEVKYTFEDRTPLLGYTYYRLKAIDLDNSFEYFGLKAVKLIGNKEIFVTPNPSSSDRINVVSNFNPSDFDMVILRNSLGNEILRTPVSTNSLELAPNSPLSSGLYLVEYVGENFSQVVRVLVK